MDRILNFANGRTHHLGNFTRREILAKIKRGEKEEGVKVISVSKYKTTHCEHCGSELEELVQDNTFELN